MYIVIGIVCFVASLVAVIISVRLNKLTVQALQDFDKAMSDYKKLIREAEQEVRRESAYVSHVEKTLNLKMNTVLQDFEGFKRWHYNRMKAEEKTVDVAEYNFKETEKLDDKDIKPMGTIEVSYGTKE